MSDQLHCEYCYFIIEQQRLVQNSVERTKCKCGIIYCEKHGLYHALECSTCTDVCLCSKIPAIPLPEGRKNIQTLSEAIMHDILDENKNEVDGKIVLNEIQIRYRKLTGQELQ